MDMAVLIWLYGCMDMAVWIWLYMYLYMNAWAEALIYVIVYMGIRGCNNVNLHRFYVDHMILEFLLENTFFLFFFSSYFYLTCFQEVNLAQSRTSTIASVN